MLLFCQVFTVSKDLVPPVLSRIVTSVADEMCRLMQCVSSFSKNGALQVHDFSHSKTLTHKPTPHLLFKGGSGYVISSNATSQLKKLTVYQLSLGLGYT